MELLSPAGNVEKLYYAYAYGADAAYIGLKKFSLRIKADNFYEDEYKKVCELKKQFQNRKLYCALNIAFHNYDIESFKENINYFKQYPIDAFIVQDLGVVPILQKEFPNAHLHLSTQASCINSESAKMYKSLGFKRIVLGREAGLKEIREIKDAVPNMELEVFCHGAMCIAYSGRCLMSAYLTSRSAQSGFCSHSCRWDFDVKINSGKEKFSVEDVKQIAQSGSLALEEHSRPGEYFPIYEGDDFTAILSSKDLRMIEHLDDLKKAGVDALKIEGRMKSIYYVALVTRAYRKALDALEGKISNKEAAPFIQELENARHREFTTGFFYNKSDADKTTSGESESPYELVGTIGKKLNAQEITKIFEAGKQTIKTREDNLNAMHPNAKKARLLDYQKNPERAMSAPPVNEKWFMYYYRPLNLVNEQTQIEFVSPKIVSIQSQKNSWFFVDKESGLTMPWSCNGHDCILYTQYDLEESTLVRAKNSVNNDTK